MRREKAILTVDQVMRTGMRREKVILTVDQVMRTGDAQREGNTHC